MVERNPQDNLHTYARLALCGSTALGLAAIPAMTESVEPSPDAVVAPVPAGILAAHGLVSRLPSTEKKAQSSFPKAAENFANDTTVSMWGNACSGTTVDNAGIAIGVVFSEQCLKITGNTAWQGSNYQHYLISSRPIVAEAGATEKELRPLGDITGVVLYRSSKSDVAIGVLDGANTNEVIDTYQKEHLSAAEINKLTPGKSKIYLEGWPTNQKKGQNGLLSPQKFEMVYIGMTQDYMGPLILGAIPKSEKIRDDAFCSYGAIGANGFVLKGGQAKVLGTLSAFFDFSKLHGTDKYPDLNKISAAQNKQVMEELFPHVDWDKYSGVCGFDDFTSLDTSAKYQTDIIPNFEVVPGFGHKPGNIDMLTYSADVAFNDTAAQRLRVIGGAVITLKNQSGGNEPPIVIRDPLISVATNGDIVLGEYNDPGTLNAIDTDTAGAKVIFYQNSPSTPLSTEVSNGKLVYPLVNTKGNIIAGSFVKDTHGEIFGAVEKSTSGLDTSKAFTVSVENGKFVFQPSGS